MGKGRSNTNSLDNNNNGILVVDDEYNIADLVKKSLEVNGQKVCGFTDANTALNHFNSDSNEKHTIVISDIRMPGMNGYEFVRKVKENDLKVKVILMSAFEIQQREFHNMLPDIKVDAFLQKPFSIQLLYDMILKMNT